MPPAKRLALDERSETSSLVNGQKDRVHTAIGASKLKKNSIVAVNDPKSAVVNGIQPVTNGVTARAEPEAPQTDWTSMPIPTLHTYRAAYKISTPASYTHPHADLIYDSSLMAKRSPSQVLARRKLRDLKSHRRKLAQTNGHGVTKSTKSKLRDKEKDTLSETSRDGRRKVNGLNSTVVGNGDSIAQSIEPTSPTIASLATTDSASSSLLNSSNPEATIIGRQTPAVLSTTIRKHFNAQPLHEHETIARFTYVLRQQGYGTATLPITTAANTSGATNVATVPRASRPIRVEGCDGDGDGWIMGSMGRQVRMSDTGGGGAFRLRFRP